MATFELRFDYDVVGEPPRLLVVDQIGTAYMEIFAEPIPLVENPTNDDGHWKFPFWAEKVVYLMNEYTLDTSKEVAEKSMEGPSQARKTLKIYGANDDLLEVEGNDELVELDVYCDSYLVGRFNIDIGDKRYLEIYCIYAGFWAFAIGPDSGDFDEMPDWEIKRTWGKDIRYSETITLSVPANAKLSFEKFG